MKVLRAPLSLMLAALLTPVSPAAGQPQSSFTTSPVALGGNHRAVAVGDLNDDGSDDFVVATGPQAPMSLALRTGDGFTIKQLGAGATEVGIADLNDDGILDIAAIGGSPHVHVFYGNGNFGGTGDQAFAPVVDVETGSAEGSLAIADMNGDDRLDIVSVAATTRR